MVDEEFMLRLALKDLAEDHGWKSVIRVARELAQEAQDAQFDCLDCGTSTLYNDEYYMLRDEVWETIVPCGVGMLCFDCAEDRLERTLTWSDFSDAPINEIHLKNERFRPS